MSMGMWWGAELPGGDEWLGERSERKKFSQ
jgi:hypothetical protein